MSSEEIEFLQAENKRISIELGHLKQQVNELYPTLLGMFKDVIGWHTHEMNGKVVWHIPEEMKKLVNQKKSFGESLKVKDGLKITKTPVEK